jgi:HEAT repeat protein
MLINTHINRSAQIHLPIFYLLLLITSGCSEISQQLPAIVPPEEVSRYIHQQSSIELAPSGPMPEVLESEDISSQGILFLAQQSHAEKEGIKPAIERYIKWKKSHASHDDQLLQQIASIQINTSFRGKKRPEQAALALANLMAKSRNNWEFYQEGIFRCPTEIAVICLQALFELGDQRAESILLHEINLIPIPELRLEIAYYLAKRNYPQTVYYLQALKNDLSKELYPVLPFLVALLDSPEAQQELLNLLYHEDQEVVANTALAIAEMNKAHLAPQLLSLLQRPSPLILSAVALALGELKYEPSRSLLIDLTSHKDSKVVINARYALYKMGDVSQIGLILSMVNSSPSATGAALLGQFHSAIPLLTQLSKDPDNQITYNAAISLLALRQEIALPALKPLFAADMNLGIQWVSSPLISEYRIRPNSHYLWNKEPMRAELSLRIKEGILQKWIALSLRTTPSSILKLVEQLDPKLIPTLIASLQNSESAQALELLMQLWQYPGNPLLRIHAGRALFEMNIQSIKKQLYSQMRQWLTLKENKVDVITLRPYVDWSQRKKNSSPITPELRSQLLMSLWKTLAQSHEDEALDLLVELWPQYPRGSQYILAATLIQSNGRS